MNELFSPAAEELELELDRAHKSKRNKANKGMIRDQRGNVLVDGDGGEGSTSRSISSSESSGDETETISISLHIHRHLMNTDDLMKICGEGGVWQIFIFIVGSLCGFNCAMQNFIYIFISHTPDHWCSLPEVDPALYTQEQLKHLVIPYDNVTGFSKCTRYASTVSDGKIVSVNHSRIEKCHTEQIPLEFDMHGAEETIGTEWSLTCEDAMWLPTVEAVYMIGVLVGSIVFGILADRLGRRMTIWISTFMFVVFAPLVALSTNFVTLIIFRFLLGMSSPGVYSTTYVLVVEATGHRLRGVAGSLYSIPYGIGYMALPIVAYFIRDWRTLQLITAASTSIMIVTWWHLPESPRWLLVQGRVTEAEKLFREIADINGKELPDDFHHLVKKATVTEKKTKRELTCEQRCRKCISGMCPITHHHVLHFRLLIMSICFIAVSLVYYGIAINTVNVGFDKYLFTFLCGFFDIPVEVVVAWLVQTHGRRYVFSGFFLSCGLFLLLSLAAPQGSAMNMILFVCAQVLISGNCTLIFLYCAELFPTDVRGYCLGICSMVGRSGSVTVPWIVAVVGQKHHKYPAIIFGATAITAGALSLLLPETRHKQLPETVEEVEKSKSS